MGTIASQITSHTIVYSIVYLQIKENIKAPRHWPLCREFTGGRWIPRTNGQLCRKCFHLMASSWPEPIIKCVLRHSPQGNYSWTSSVTCVWRLQFKNYHHISQGPMSLLMKLHYSNIIMNMMASLITGIWIVYSSVCSGADQRKYQSSVSLALCAGNSPVTGEFPAQRVSNAENVSIWWHHHGIWDQEGLCLLRGRILTDFTIWMF